MLVALAILIAFGVQIAVALGVVSIAAVYVVTGEGQAVSRLLAATAYSGLRAEVLIAIPLFTLMGEFIVRSGAVTDLYRAARHALHAAPGGALLAAGISNALHAFAAGSSTSGAAGFSRAPYEDLRRCGYDRALSLGSLASASSLGMLLPPGVLMLTWAILGGLPAGAIFLAMLVPALLIVAGFAATVMLAGGSRGAGRDTKTVGRRSRSWLSLTGIALVFVAVLGGIGTRALSPAEAASVGAAIGLVMALGKGMRPAAIVEAILVAGRASAPILLLIFAALIFAQALAVTGAGAAIQAMIAGLGRAPALAVMIAIWLVLATALEPMSAAALTVTVFVPVAVAIGFDPLAFAALGIVVLEAAALVPPLGLLAFTTKAAVDDDSVAVLDIFRHVLPFLAVLLAAILIVALVPKVAIWLPYALL